MKVVDMNVTDINCCDKNINFVITLHPYRDYWFCWLSDYIESNIYGITLQDIKEPHSLANERSVTHKANFYTMALPNYELMNVCRYSAVTTYNAVRKKGKLIVWKPT
jgi:hypothetical protein